MNQGFIRAAAATPKIRVADPEYNAGQITDLTRQAAAAQAKIIVFPELCLTGYTCGDLFLQTPLLLKAREQLSAILKATKDLDLVAFIGDRKSVV